MGSVNVIGDDQFQEEVLEAGQPVLVYFWASWCGPCRLTAPLVEQVATAYSDRIKVVKMEVDPSPESVALCRVEGVPAFRVFQNGEIKHSKEGAISKPQLEAFVDQSLAAV